MQSWRQTNKTLSKLLFSAASSSPSPLTTLTLLSSSSSSSSSSSLSDLLLPHCFLTSPVGNVDACPWAVIQRRGLKVNASQLKPGNVIEKSGKLYQVLKSEHKQRGRGGAIMQMEVRDMDHQSISSMRFGTEESVERVYVEEKSLTCLYKEHETVYLMDAEAFEQLEVPAQLFGNAAVYLKEDMKVKLQLYDGRPLSGSIPKHVTCSIVETPPHAKGQSATPRYKRALLDNGLTIQVPPYLETGEAVVVNTEDNSFVSRDK